MAPADCDAARASIPDLLDGPGAAEADAVRHVAGCPACAAELETLRRSLAAVMSLATEPVPDPGAVYWHGFAAQVRRRIDGQEASSAHEARGDAPRHRLMSAAAACVLLAAAALALWSPRERGHAEVTEATLTAALREATRAGGPGVEALDLEISFDEEVAGEAPDIGPGNVLEVLRETGAPAGLIDFWDDAELEDLVRGLDVERSRRLVAELSRQQS